MDWSLSEFYSLEQNFDSISNNSVFSVMFYGYIQKNEIIKKFKEYSKLFHYDQLFKVNYLSYNSPTQVMSLVHFHEDYLGSYIYYLYNSDLYETDHSLNNYYQIGIQDDNLLTEASILLAIIHDVARGFLLLGNKRAIGIFNIDNIIYYDFNVEHSAMTPDLLDKHIDIINDVLYSKICGMKEEEFEAYKNKVLFDLRLAYNSLSHKADLVWNEIYRNTLQFHRTTISSFIINYNKENLIEFMLKVFINKKSVRKISIQLYKPSTYYPFAEVERVFYRLNPEIASIVTKNLDILREENQRNT